MTQTIQYRRNEYIKFYASMKFKVGAGAQNITINQGDEFEYDGTVLKYSGLEFQQPGLRSAIASGWATTNSNGVPVGGVQSTVPVRNVAAAQVVTTDLSGVKRTTSIDTSEHDENHVLNVDARGTSANTSVPPKIITASSRKSLMDEQGGKEIGKIGVPAKQIFDGVSSIERNAQDLENKKRTQPAFQQQEGVTMKVSPTVKSEVVASQEDGVHVASVRQTAPISKEVMMSDTSVRPSKTPISSENRMSIDTSVRPRIRIARRIYPSFPENWVFSGKLADRFKAVENYGVTPEFLEALYAAEGDQMRKFLESKYPNQFGLTS